MLVYTKIIMQNVRSVICVFFIFFVVFFKLLGLFQVFFYMAHYKSQRIIVSFEFINQILNLCFERVCFIPALI